MLPPWSYSSKCNLQSDLYRRLLRERESCRNFWLALGLGDNLGINTL